MTENESNGSPKPEVNREDDTTHIAQRDSTREMPVQPSQQSSWSGSSASAHNSEEADTQAAYPSASSSHYPSAPPQNGNSWASPQSSGQQAPQGYSGGFNPAQSQDSGSAPQSSWSSQPYGTQQPYNSAGPAQTVYGSAPQSSWSGQPSNSAGNGNPFASAQTGSGYGTQAPQQSFGAPGQQQVGQPYSASPFGAKSGSQKPAGSQHRLSPLEKFGPFLPAFIAFLAAFLTWTTFKSGAQTVSLNGVGGNNNSANPDLGGAKSTGGWITIVFALGLAGVAVAAILGKLRAMVVACTTIALSALIFIVGLVQFANVNAVVNSDAGNGYSGTIGIGVWLTLFAGLVGVGLGIAGIVAARKKKSGGSGASSPAGFSRPGGYDQSNNASAGNASWSQNNEQTSQGPNSSWGQGR